MDHNRVGGAVMNHQGTIYSGTAVIAAAGIAVSAAACGASSPSKASPSSSVRYYQDGYRYARANISPPEHRILRNAGYAKWCARGSTATNELNSAGGPSSKAAKHWLKGCDGYAASDGLPATASHVPAARTKTVAPTQPPPPTQAPSSPANPNGVAPQNPDVQPSPPPAPAPSQPPPYRDPVTGQTQQAPAPPPGGYPGGSQNVCNGPNASEFGDCVPGGGTNGGR